MGVKRQTFITSTALQKLWGDGGANRFFNKGANRRWEGVFSPDDLASYDAKVRSFFEPELAQWVEHGSTLKGH